MSDDYNSIINGQDDYTNRIVSSKAEADSMSEARVGNGGVDLVEKLEMMNRANQGAHPKEAFPQPNIPAPSKGKDPF